MTNSIFLEVYERKDLKPDLFFDFLNSRGLEFFRSILGSRGESDAKMIALYIICGYSEDSTMVINGSEWSANKKEIAESIGLPVDLYEATLYLCDMDVISAVTRYLDLQGRNFMHLQVKKDLYDRFVGNLIKASKNEEGNTDLDYKELVSSSQYTDKLKEDIELLEQDFDQKSNVINNGKKELSIAKKNEKAKNINIESSKYIVR